MSESTGRSGLTLLILNTFEKKLRVITGLEDVSAKGAIFKPEKEPEKEPIIDLPIIDLQEIQNSELKNTDLQPDFFNYTVVRKFPLLITAEDFEKGLENKTEFFNHSDENPKKIQILIKIKKYIVHK